MVAVGLPASLGSGGSNGSNGAPNGSAAARREAGGAEEEEGTVYIYVCIVVGGRGRLWPSESVASVCA